MSNGTTAIKNNAYTPKTIGYIKFRIPLYQRPYAWEHTQVSQLLQDLKEQFIKNKSENYYIGILSIGNTHNETLFDLVDGQQRITTLILIGLVLKEYNKDWSDFLTDRLDLYGREEDTKYIKSFDESANPNPKLVEAIETITKFIDDNLKQNQDIDLAAFSKFVYEKAAFFLSKIPADYSVVDKNLHFVRMNNRGKQLEAHEILKIKLASYLGDNSDSNDRSEFIKSWNKFAQLGCDDYETNQEDKYETNQEDKVEKKLSDILDTDYPNDKKAPVETEIFYQSIISFPEFLLIALSRYLDKDISFAKDKLLETFGFGATATEIWDEKKVKEFFKLLEIQYVLFNNYIIKRDKEERYKFKKVDTFTSGENSGENSVKKLKMFQSMLYVSYQQSPHLWLKKAFDYLQNQPQALNAGYFLLELKAKDNARHPLPPTLGKLSYVNGIDRHWFWRLDYYLWEMVLNENKEVPKNILNNQKIKDAIRNYIFRPNRSIEHLHPQSVSGFGDILHSFGNLAMISKGFNSTQSNNPVNVKFARIKNQIEGKSTLESIKLLYMYVAAKENPEEWTKDNAKDHGKDMYKILENFFTVRSQ